MTPAELLALADAATEQVRFVGHPDFMEINATLSALAPDLARLCAEMGEALEAVMGSVAFYPPSPAFGADKEAVAKTEATIGKIDAALAKLSELKP